MFEVVGTICRLPLGLLWIVIVFAFWPLGVLFGVGIIFFGLAKSPLVFLSAAFSKDKQKWEEFCKEYFDGKILSPDISQM